MNIADPAYSGPYDNPLNQPRRFYPRRIVIRLRLMLPIVFVAGFILGAII